MIEMLHNVWQKTFPNVYNEQIFKFNMMALTFRGSEEHLASKSR